MKQQSDQHHRSQNQQLPQILTQSKTHSQKSIHTMTSVLEQRQSVTTNRKIQVFLCSFLAYTSVHALRTTYSFSKSYLPQQINMQQQLIGIVDSVMLLFIGLGNFLIAVRPFSKPIRALWIALFLCAVQYCLVPLSMDILSGPPAFATLVILMGLSGFLQSFTWPNLLPLVHTVCSPDKDTTILGFWATCPNFGNILGFIICQYFVLNNGYSWQVGMYIIAIYMMCNAIYIALRMDQMPNDIEIQVEVEANVQKQKQKQKYNNKDGSNKHQDDIHNKTNNPLNLSSQNLQKSLIGPGIQSQDNVNIDKFQFNLRRVQSSPASVAHSSVIHVKSAQPSVIEVFKNSPRVTLLTISFSLLKSVMYGILLWLPAYFYSIGLVQYSLYIPMTFDAASIVGSTILGAIFKVLPPNKKNIALIPVLFFLMIFFIMLKLIDFSVAGYFIIIALVGLCLGGSYNTMAGLVTMQLVRTIPPQLQTKYLRFYSALLMAIANVLTGITQIIISYTVDQDQGKLFGIFVIYTAINLCCIVGVVMIQVYTLKTIPVIDRSNIKSQKYEIFKDQRDQHNEPTSKPIVTKTQQYQITKIEIDRKKNMSEEVNYQQIQFGEIK